mgnify:CR=1 FL=1
MSNILGKRIKQVRQELGLVQEEFAKKIEVGGKSTVSQYESGINSPDDDIKIRIAKLGNVSLDWLLGLSSEKKPFKSGPYNKFLLKCIEEGILEEGVEPDDDLINSLVDIMKVAKKHLDVKKANN